jgi:hypothetical protein
LFLERDGGKNFTRLIQHSHPRHRYAVTERTALYGLCVTFYSDKAPTPPA